MRPDFLQSHFDYLCSICPFIASCGLRAMLMFYQTLIMINFLILTYAKFLLFLLSLGSSNARTILDGFGNTQVDLLRSPRSIARSI